MVSRSTKIVIVKIIGILVLSGLAGLGAYVLMESRQYYIPERRDWCYKNLQKEVCDRRYEGKIPRSGNSSNMQTPIFQKWELSDIVNYSL